MKGLSDYPRSPTKLSKTATPIPSAIALQGWEPVLDTHSTVPSFSCFPNSKARLPLLLELSPLRSYSQRHRLRKDFQVLNRENFLIFLVLSYLDSARKLSIYLRKHLNCSKIFSVILIKLTPIIKIFLDSFIEKKTILHLTQ